MILEKLIFPLVALSAFLFGFFIYCKPEDMFEIQRKFYALINWKIEPISLAKEIRNTKAMGLFLIVFVLGACAYRWLR